MLTRTVQARVTTFAYDPTGNLTQVVLPDGSLLTYSFDGANRLIGIADNLGNTIAYTLDAAGNRVKEDISDSRGVLTRTNLKIFDELSRLIQNTEGAGQQTGLGYDTNGNLLSVIDGKNNTKVTTFDALNRQIDTTDAANGIESYEYDTLGHITKVTDPSGVVTEYSYNALDDLLEVRSPDSGVTTHSYDYAGNRVASTDATGTAVTFAYDALNRQTKVDYPGNQEDIVYEYDTCKNGIGQLCLILDQSGHTSYEYDAFGNIVTQKKRELNVVYITRYIYDAIDRLITVIYPNGRQVDYTRDAIGRVTDISTTVRQATVPLITGMTYDAANALSQQNFDNGLGEIRQYDPSGRMTNLTLGGVDTRTYSYDANNNVLNIDTIGTNDHYSYDVLDRLIADQTASLSFNYDANDNRLSETNSLGTQPYTYFSNTNRLQAVNGNPITVDATGNILSDQNGKRVFEYNSAGRLFKVYTVNQSQRKRLRATYTYNGLGQRTRKVTNGRTTVYHYDLKGNLIAETRANGSPIKDYIWSGNRPVAQIKTAGGINGAIGNKEIIYLHADHLNTPRLGTDVTGVVVWRWDSSAFGEGIENRDPDGDGNNVRVALRFPGQYFDGESGLHYNWNRYYDPQTGRYITSDPIGLAGGSNPFVYVNVNPLRFIDLSGELSVEGSIEKAAKSAETVGKVFSVVDGVDFFNTSIDIFNKNEDAIAACDKLCDPIEKQLCKNEAYIQNLRNIRDTGILDKGFDANKFIGVFAIF